MDTREEIIELLRSTERPGIETLISYLISQGYFYSPASTRFHCSYEGGLAVHHLDVYKQLVNLVAIYKPETKSGYGMMMCKFDKNTLIIAALLHDVCKIGAYQRTKKDDGWTNNRQKEKGHAKLSLERIQKFIKLEKIEMLMIKYHMNIWGLQEFHEKPEDPNAEYSLEYPLRGNTTPEQKKAMSPEEKKADQKRRYGESLANAIFHNPIVWLMSTADMLATMAEKAAAEKDK